MPVSLPEITNAIYLLGAFLCLNLGATPEQAWRPFSGLEDSQLLPYRDATWAKSPFDLEIRDCWAGLQRAVSTGFDTYRLIVRWIVGRSKIGSKGSMGMEVWRGPDPM